MPKKRQAGPPAKRRGDSRKTRGSSGIRGVRQSKRQADGCALTVRVVERQGSSEDRADVSIVFAGGPAPGRRAAGPTGEIARILASVGHSARLRILWLLLKGPAVYRAVQRATGLQPGPLYHHINQLRLAGLIRPKQRDLYELTRGGRNVVLIATALNKLAKDVRPRSVPRD